MGRGGTCVEMILNGRAAPWLLLAVGVALYVYFLPACIAFVRGHRRFVWIAVLNLPLFAVQGEILLRLFPGFFVVNVANIPHAIFAGFIANLGVGWLALLWWALRPIVTPDPRLLAWRQTKGYDVLAGLPLALWFFYSVLRLRPSIAADLHTIAEGVGTAFTWARLFALTGSVLFNLLLVWLLLVRDKPVLKSRGFLPRAAAFAGTFLGVGITQLPVAELSLPVQIASAVLVGVGSVLAALVLSRLGKSFSIMPEARTLVTSGPYALARHPLYAVELIIIAGTSLQFVQPWAAIMAVAVAGLLVLRTVFEERVLAQAYPEYEAYRLRVKRFIPGII